MKKEDTRDLFIRSPVEEFKAFARHKIELLEKFREVDDLKKYMDAFELGMSRLNAAIMKAPSGPEPGPPSQQAGAPPGMPVGAGEQGPPARNPAQAPEKPEPGAAGPAGGGSDARGGPEGSGTGQAGTADAPAPPSPRTGNDDSRVD